jgi:hypothetical protein
MAFTSLMAPMLVLSKYSARIRTDGIRRIHPNFTQEEFERKGKVIRSFKAQEKSAIQAG